MMNIIEKTYADFISIVGSKNLSIMFKEEEEYYELTARDGIIFYRTYVRKNGGTEQLDFETNYKPSSNTSFSDGSIPIKAAEGSIPVTVTGNIGFFTKPYNSISVVSKDACGNPTAIKSTYDGVDVQLLNIVYDADGDLQSAVVSNL